MTQKALVWDMPTRVFHWTFALSFAGAYLTAESERYRDIHLALGYMFGGMLVFRMVWGIVGTRYARFASFAFQPQTVWAYVRSLFGAQPQHFVGHNPVGGLAIFSLLGLGLVITLSGLGLYWEFGEAVLGDELHEIAANVMLVVVFLHLAGVVLSSWLHRENLVRAMLTGYKQATQDAAIPHAYAALAVLMLVAVVVFLLVYLGIA